jgi:hypothetical protein
VHLHHLPQCVECDHERHHDHHRAQAPASIPYPSCRV